MSNTPLIIASEPELIIRGVCEIKYGLMMLTWVRDYKSITYKIHNMSSIYSAEEVSVYSIVLHFNMTSILLVLY
jgi:hypothetical protein